MTDLIFILIVAGVICWIISRAPFIAEFFKVCIYAVIGLAVLYKVIQYLPALGL